MFLPLPKNILVLRLSSIGDILLTSAFLRVLREKAGKEAVIDFVVKEQFASLVRFNPGVTNVHLLKEKEGIAGLFRLGSQLRMRRYETVFDLHNNIRTKILRRGIPGISVINKRIIARTQLVCFKRNIYHDVMPVALRCIETASRYGIEDDGKGLELFIPEEIKSKVQTEYAQFLKSSSGPVIGICPGARHCTKRWMPEKFSETIIRLHKKLGARFLLFGGKEDMQRCSRIQSHAAMTIGSAAVVSTAGCTSLLETAALMGRCRSVLANDSGLMHMAAAMKRPVAAVFGSTVKEFGFYPFGTASIVLENVNLACRPCSHIGRESCPEKHLRCLEDIRVEDAVKAIESFEIMQNMPGKNASLNCNSSA